MIIHLIHRECGRLTSPHRHPVNARRCGDETRGGRHRHDVHDCTSTAGSAPKTCKVPVLLPLLIRQQCIFTPITHDVLLVYSPLLGRQACERMPAGPGRAFRRRGSNGDVAPLRSLLPLEATPPGRWSKACFLLPNHHLLFPPVLSPPSPATLTTCVASHASQLVNG